MNIDQVLKLEFPHRVETNTRMRLRRSNLRDMEVREILHARLTEAGFKRNPVLSDCYAAVYDCVRMRVYLTHYARETVVELEYK